MTNVYRRLFIAQVAALMKLTVISIAGFLGVRFGFLTLPTTRRESSKIAPILDRLNVAQVLGKTVDSIQETSLC